MFSVSSNKVEEATTVLLNEPEIAEKVSSGDLTMREARRERYKANRDEKGAGIAGTPTGPKRGHLPSTPIVHAG
jgi:hypothetical protein